MKRFLHIILAALLSLNFSCDSDDNESTLTKDGWFHISELNGNWVASKAQFSVNTTSVDVVEDGGTASMTVQSDGRFILTINPNDRIPYSVTGEMFWEEWQQTYYFAIVWDDNPNDWDTYGYTFDGTTLSLNGGTDSGEYDFDNDGDFEPCTVHFIFVRTETL